MIRTRSKPSEAAPCTRGLLGLGFGVCTLRQRSEVPQWHGFTDSPVFFLQVRERHTGPGLCGKKRPCYCGPESSNCTRSLDISQRFWTFKDRVFPYYLGHLKAGGVAYTPNALSHLPTVLPAVHRDMTFSSPLYSGHSVPHSAI